MYGATGRPFTAEELRAAAQEFTQDTFVRAFDRIHQFRGEAAFSTWLNSIATSVIYNGLRKVKRFRQREFEYDEVGAIPGSERRAEPDLKEKLTRAIEDLPVKYRMVFVMHDVEGYTHQEISSALGMQVGTSKAQLSRARAKLREALAQAKPGDRRYFEDPDSPFLRLCRFGDERWIGKVMDAGLNVTEVEDIQRNVLSILRRIAPDVRKAPSTVKIFALGDEIEEAPEAAGDVDGGQVAETESDALQHQGRGRVDGGFGADDVVDLGLADPDRLAAPAPLRRDYQVAPATTIDADGVASPFPIQLARSVDPAGQEQACEE